MLTTTYRSCPPENLPEEERFGFYEVANKFDWLYRPVLTWLSDIAPQCRSLLDVGCGEGQLTRLAKKAHPHLRVGGIDVDPEMIGAASAHPDKGAIEYQVGTAPELKESWDIVVCNLVLHHLGDPVANLKSMLAQTQKVLVLCDQIRPLTTDELEERLRLRKLYLKQHMQGYQGYYGEDEHERASILESYSMHEVKELSLQAFGPRIRMHVVDWDYYQRVLVTVHRKDLMA